jgi:predicted AlkP superfamily phosphohydrolase/phosphomutase
MVRDIMKKVLVIGIDALDSLTLNNLKHELPVFSKLIADTPDINFDGVFPPDSPTSWASIYTGLSPSRHGIILFFDPLKRVSTMITKDVDDSSIRGNTFWDISGQMGKKVIVIPHLLGYPVWPVNGLMIGRSGINQDVQMFPNDLAFQLNLPQLKWELKNFPGRDKEKYIKTAENQLQREKNAIIDIMKKVEWDLFFVSFGELDTIQYSFWNFYDKKDPSYPGENSYANVIPRFYKLYDCIIGDFISALDSETVVIVVSDHGIGSRPVRLININELLRENGLLSLKRKSKDTNKSQCYTAGLKKCLLKFIDQNNLGNIAAFGLRIFPRGKEWYISSGHIDWGKSSAYLTDQSGIKNYPYGGIIVEQKNMKDYEKNRDLIIKELSSIRDPITNELIMNWICKREQLYSGEYQGRYPDILFELRENYGAGITTPAELFDRSVSHNIAPGCHKQHQATFLISGINNRQLSRASMSLMDVCPTILDILGIRCEFDFDGGSIFENEY